MSGEDEPTSRECSGCGAMNRFDYTYCHACRRPLGDRAHASSTFPAIAATLLALIECTDVLLDDAGLEAVARARALVAKFDSWKEAPPRHDERNAELDAATAVAAELRKARAEALKR